jgi:hypothetical protein
VQNGHCNWILSKGKAANTHLSLAFLHLGSWQPFLGLVIKPPSSEIQSGSIICILQEIKFSTHSKKNFFYI